MSESVVDTDASSKTEVEGSDAQDLDSVLAEYDAGTEQQQTSQTSQSTQSTDKTEDVSELVSWAKEERQRRMQEDTNKGISHAIERITDGLEVKIPERAIRGILYEKAESDPRFRQAWASRDTNPQGFERVLKAMQAEIKAEFTDVVDKNVTDDREALASAVRGASKTTTQETAEVDLSKVSDEDFQKELRKYGL